MQTWHGNNFCKNYIELELMGGNITYPPLDQLIAFWLCCNCWQLCKQEIAIFYSIKSLLLLLNRTHVIARNSQIWLSGDQTICNQNTRCPWKELQKWVSSKWVQECWTYVYMTKNCFFFFIFLSIVDCIFDGNGGCPQCWLPWTKMLNPFIF